MASSHGRPSGISRNAQDSCITERSLPSHTRIPRPVRAHGRAKSRLTGSSGPTEVLALLKIDSIYRNSNQEVKKVVSRAFRENEHTRKKATQNLRRENEQRTRELDTEKKKREEAETALERERLCRGRERKELADSLRKSQSIKDLEKRLEEERTRGDLLSKQKREAEHLNTEASQRIKNLERILREERARGQLLSEQKREAEHLNTKAQDEVYQLGRALRDQKQMIDTLSIRVTEEKERNKEEIRKKGVLEAEKLGLQEELQRLQEEYGGEQTRANNLMGDHARVLQQNEELNRENSQSESENNALRVQNEELERKCAEQERSIKQLQAAHGHIQQEHDQLRASYSSLEEQHLVLTRTHAELQNSKELLKARYVRTIVSLTGYYRNRVMFLREDLDALWTAYTDSEGHSLDLQDSLDILREQRRNTAAREWQNGDHDGIRRTRVQEPAFVRRKSEMTLRARNGTEITHCDSQPVKLAMNLFS